MYAYAAQQASDAPEFWYRQKVMERIWALAHKYRDRPDEFVNMSEYDLNEPALVRNSRTFFGTWLNALTAAGVNNGGRGTGGHGAQTLQLSKQRLLEIISGLAASGEDMSAENMIVMHNPLWKAACGRSGFFSHWPTVLRHAGVDHYSTYREPYWSDLRVRNSVIDLFESQLVLSGPYIRYNFWHLYRFGLRYHSSWKAVVNSTGLGYENVMTEHAASGARREMFQQNLLKMLEREGRDLRFITPDTVPRTAANFPGIFCEDISNGTILGTLPRSWLPGIEPKIGKMLHSDPSVRMELYYLSGEPREWKNNRVVFIPVTDLIQESFEIGCDRYMREILKLQYNVPSFL